jgi:hypothetical protein
MSRTGLLERHAVVEGWTVPGIQAKGEAQDQTHGSPHIGFDEMRNTSHSSSDKIVSRRLHSNVDYRSIGAAPRRGRAATLFGLVIPACRR